MGGLRLNLLIIVAVCASGAAALVPLAWTGVEALRASSREHAVRDMTANANLLAMALASPEAAEAEGRAALIARAREEARTRFTIMAADGTVLLDSDEDAARMDNHANRPEMREALAGRTGANVRHSPTMGTDWIYLARPLPDGSVLRAAAPLDEVDRRLAQWWRRAAVGCAASLVLLLALALLVGRALSRPLEVAAAGADRYAKGDFAYRVPVAGSAEMRRLARALGVMAEELDQRFSLITRQREEMRSVFETMSEGVLAADADGRILLHNRRAVAMLRLDADAAQTGAELAAVVRIPELLDLFHAAADRDGPVEAAIRVDGDGGDEALVEAHAVRLVEGERPLGVVAVLRDVTRMRRLEAMRRDFVANVSHELRTPVTTVQSCLETVLEEGTDDRETAGEFLRMALRNTRRMGSIINNLLFLAGMESGAEAAGEAADFPVRPVLDEAVTLCREDARGGAARIDVVCDSDLTAVMNPPLVVHAVVNLLDNAVKYGPEGGAVRVEAARDGDRVRITVSDEGPGIAPRHQPRVFERFYRVNGSTRVKEGTGLGLALVKHIALAQGGDITLHSEIGAGSEFVLTLPARRG